LLTLCNAFWFSRSHYMMRLRFFIFLVLMIPQAVYGGENSLAVSTKSQVDEQGGVTVFLTLKNTGRRPLFEIHPMFHFHHTNSMMAMIPELKPGKTVVLENHKHPPVVRVGRYPLVVMAHYKNNREQAVPFTALHTDSFYYREPVISAVGGRIESVVEPKGSFLKVLLQNNSSALKKCAHDAVASSGRDSGKIQGDDGGYATRWREKIF